MGNSHETGVQLGKYGARAVHEHLLPSAVWAKVQSFKGSVQANKMAELTQQHFPEIWLEIKGLAQGLQLSLEEVFLWNARGDLWAMAPDGCTTIMDLPNGKPRISHNEDGDPMFNGHCAIAQFNNTQGTNFTSFVYPGSIPGHSLAVNSAGLAMTVNNIRALTVDAGIPRMVVTRAILNTKNTDQAIDLLSKLPLSGAFHLNLTDQSGKQLLSIEYSSNYLSVKQIKQPYMHANHAIHASTRDWPQIITGSSGRRQLRGLDLLKQDGFDPLKILTDTNSSHPIFRRSPDDTDNENTLATVSMQVQDNCIHWQVYEDPRLPATFNLKNDQFID